MQLSRERATKIIVHAAIWGYCCSTQAPFTEYRLTDQIGRSTEIGRIAEVVLEEVRTKGVQEVDAYVSCCMYKSCRSNSRDSISN